MTALLTLCRPYYAGPIALAFLLTVFYARGGDMVGEWPSAWLATGALALTIMSGHVLNDVFDRVVDGVNAPSRPIPSGRVAPGPAAVFAAIFAAAGLALGWLASEAFAGILAGVTATLVFYNLTSKRLGLGKPILVALLMTSIYPLAFAQAGGARGARAGALAVFPVIVFLLTLSYQLLKDVRDVAGDRLLARPGPVQRHPARARAFAHVVAVLGGVLLAGPALLGCRWVYLAGASVSFGLIVAGAFLPLRLAIAAGYLQIAALAAAATLDVLCLEI